MYVPHHTQKKSLLVAVVQQQGDEDTETDSADVVTDDIEEQTDTSIRCDRAAKCKRCLVCAMKIIHELNTQGSMYDSLYKAYQFALTLSCTEVSCERAFSVLKIVKNRLRSSLGQEQLESFMLFYVTEILNLTMMKPLTQLLLVLTNYRSI